MEGFSKIDPFSQFAASHNSEITQINILPLCELNKQEKYHRHREGAVRRRRSFPELPQEEMSADWNLNKKNHHPVECNQSYKVINPPHNSHTVLEIQKKER